MQHTLSLLGTLTDLQPGLSEVMLSSAGLGPALEFSLLHTPEKLVRREVSAGVLRMALALRPTSKVCALGGGGCPGSRASLLGREYLHGTVSIL